MLLESQIRPNPVSQLYSEDFVNLYAKLENLNPTGSIKYRVARQLVEAAERNGHLRTGMKIIEESSGNTGIALSMLGKERGYGTTIVVSEEGCTKEAQAMMKGYGATVIPVKGWIEERKALINEIMSEDPSYYWTRQFDNPASLQSSMNLGEEILQQLPRIDFYLACTGTGATITGVGRVLKQKNPETLVIAVVPARDFNFPGVDDYRTYYEIAPLLDRSVIDDNFVIEDESYIIDAMKKLRDVHGHFVGLSSAAAYFAASELVEKVNGTILIIFPDSGDRYYTLLRERFNLDLGA